MPIKEANTANTVWVALDSDVVSKRTERQRRNQNETLNALSTNQTHSYKKNKLETTLPALYYSQAISFFAQWIICWRNHGTKANAYTVYASQHMVEPIVIKLHVAGPAIQNNTQKVKIKGMKVLRKDHLPILCLIWLIIWTLFLCSFLP